ncbi:DUF1802 family protein [Effusibacillus consociatus]|uniref:DUF1802 family protein n=1 Tax=Effusibacillus consociatus TaxID=1117041 RepID=A0ABV9Q1T9_9BACL
MSHIPPVALKEWAVAIKALDEGKQILLIRKGGIREETRDFRLQENTFFLYPTYEHQKANLIKQEFQSDLEETLTDFDPTKQETVTITHYAKVVEDIELYDEETLSELAPHYIYTTSYAAERLHWKKTKPLHVLPVRAYRLTNPVSIPVKEQYLGCFSWIPLEDMLPDVDAVPVLSDDEFGQKLQQVKLILKEV